MTTPTDSWSNETRLMQPRPVVEDRKREQTSVVELAANSTLASCSGACRKNRICTHVGAAAEGEEVCLGMRWCRWVPAGGGRLGQAPPAAAGARLGNKGTPGCCARLLPHSSHAHT